jgi:hypothetical protein
MVGAIFGSAWMSWAAVFVPTARTAALVLVAVIAIFLVGWAASRLRIVRRYKDSAADRERWASVAPLFWIDTVAEWLLGAGAVAALAHFGRYALIPQVLGVIIGLHFLPLAWILRSVSLLHYGNSHNCVRVRLASHSRRQHPQRHRMRRDRPPDVDYGRGELVPRLKAIPLRAQKACEVLSGPLRLPK